MSKFGDIRLLCLELVVALKRLFVLQNKPAFFINRPILRRLI